MKLQMIVNVAAEVERLSGEKAALEIKHRDEIDNINNKLIEARGRLVTLLNIAQKQGVEL